MVTLLLSLAMSAAPQGAPHLNEAISLYESAEFEAALPLLTALAGDAASSHDDRVTALEYLAATHYALKDEAATRADLAALVAFDDSAQMNELVFNPKLRALHEELRGLAAKKKKPQEPVVTNAPSPAAVEQRQTAPSRALPFAEIAAGALLTGAGGFQLLSAQRRQTEWRQHKDDGQRLSFSQATARLDQTLNPIAWVAMGVGAAAMGYGVYGLSTSRGENASLSLIPNGAGASAVLTGRF